MSKSVSGFFGTAAVVLAVVLLVTFAVLPVAVPLSVAQVEAAEAAKEPEPAPPADQEYTGSKRCASCHFEQFMSWKQTKHSKAFDDLTAKYQKDETCLKCHTTGFGEATGYKDAGTAALAGVTCEVCHGPGSKHEEVAKPFAQVKNLTPEQEKSIRDSIWMIVPENICVTCHIVQGHQKSPTPKELQKPD